MDITSIYFGLLSVAVIFVYYLLNNSSRIYLLVLLSCIFIASYSFNLLIYVLIYALINYYIGINIPGSRISKTLFKTGIFINILQLFVLKYASFTFNPLFNILNLDIDFNRLSGIIVPIGISFFTLQGIGYLINVRMKWEQPERNFVNFLLYIIYYPKFLSGPIERSNSFLPQLKNQVLFDNSMVSDGLRIALIGVFKKVVIANSLAPYVNNAYATIGAPDGANLWILFLVQPIYLYFDFSGYTDIAIGISKTLGIKLLPNFNRPFMSDTMTGFWKRFHISLSSWFNDYIFKQLSFRYRRWGVGASVFAVFVTWVLFGIWHGAGWNFMLLGLLQAIAIIYEYFTKKWRYKLFSIFPEFLRVWIGRLFVYLFLGVCMVFFFSPDIHSVGLFFSNLGHVTDFVIGGVRKEVFLMVIFLMIISLIMEVVENDFYTVYTRLQKKWVKNKIIFRGIRWLFYFVIISIIIVFRNDVQQFIYFKF